MEEKNNGERMANGHQSRGIGTLRCNVLITQYDKYGS